MATATTAAMNNATFRTSQTQATAAGTFSYSDSPLTQLPTVDFKFEDLRKRMADFTVKFDAFIEQGRKRVLEERNDFRGRLAELGEEQRSATTQITSLQSTLSTHDHVMSREQVEKSEMHAQISKLESHQANQVAHKDKLKNSIAHTQRQIEMKVQAQREYADKLDGQARLNGPELNFWETYLGCRIEGAGDENVVKVVFTFPPARGGGGVSSAGTGTTGVGGTTTTTSSSTSSSQDEREASFELRVPATSGASYEVIYTKPKLDPAKVQITTTRLNESREIATLLKGMRVLFAEELS